MATDPKAWTDRFFGLALTVLFASLALFVAAQLLIAAWTVLVVTATVLLGLALAICCLRWWWARVGSW